MKVDLSTVELCIVGNSSCETRHGRGVIIDSFDYVARFNNFILAPRYKTDYGTKCNIWVTSFAKDVYLKKSSFEVVCCPLSVSIK